MYALEAARGLAPRAPKIEKGLQYRKPFLFPSVIRTVACKPL